MLRMTVLAGLLLSSVAGASDGQVTAFVNVGVVDPSSGAVQTGKTVIVARDIIGKIGDADDVRIPDGARTIDGQGRYLLPGLAEMHAHIPGTDAGERYLEDVLFLFVANGVTTIRGMLGQPWHLQLKQRVADGEIIGPRIYTSGPSFNGSTVTSPAQAAERVRSQKAAGYDFLKLHPGLSRAEYDAFSSAARDVGIPFGGHISRDAGLAAILDAGQATVDHLEGYIEALLAPEERAEAGDPGFFGLNLADKADAGRIEVLAKATAASGTWVVPTEALMYHVAGPMKTDELLSRPEMRYVSQVQKRQWRQRRNAFAGQRDPDQARRFLDLRLRLIRALHEAGAGLLLGSDAPQVFNVPGFSIHRELERLLAAGLTPGEALATGTTHVARFFGAEDWFGAIRAGLSADLVLLDGNPLESIEHLRDPAGVMLRGRWFDRDAINRRLDDIAQRAGGAGTD